MPSENPYKPPSSDLAPERGSLVAKVVMYLFIVIGVLCLIPAGMIVIVLLVDLFSF